MVTLGEQAGTASDPHPDLSKLGTPPASPASGSPPASRSFWRLGRVFSGSRSHPVDVGRGQTPSSVEWAFWGGCCVVGSRWGDGAAHRPPGCARATVSRAGLGVPAGWERAVPTLGCFPLSAGSPLSWDPGLARGTLTQLLGHNISGNTRTSLLVTWHRVGLSGTWLCPGEGTACAPRPTGLMVLLGNRSARDPSRTSPRPISVVGPRGADSTLVSCRKFPSERNWSW